MNKKQIVLIFCICFFIFSCEKKYSQSELIEHNLHMSEIDESTTEIVINGISAYVIEKPGLVYLEADLFIFPSDDSDLYYFYDKFFAREVAGCQLFEDKLVNKLNDKRDLYILGMTKEFTEMPWYYVRFFNTGGNFEAWIKGDSLIVKDF